MMRDQTYKQEMREPEPSAHPDPRMHMTIRHTSLRIPSETMLDPVTGRTVKKTPMLAQAEGRQGY